MTDTLSIWAALPVAILLVASGIVTLTGSVGLLRFSHFHTRVHAPTLGNTLGAAFLVLASVLVSLTQGRHPAFQDLLILLFLVITSPITTILLMQASVRGKSREPQAQAQTQMQTHDAP
jgi:multicomponent K+:H+ antiporter subunit G